MRKKRVAVWASLALLAGAVVVAYALRVTEEAPAAGAGHEAATDAAGPPALAGLAARAEAGGPAPRVAAMEEAEAPAAPAARPALAGGVPSAGDPARTGATAASPASAAPAGGDADEETDEPAVRRSAFGLPKGPGKSVGGGGDVGPTGHWTKYPPGPPPEGRAVLDALVVDADGVPVPGATVHLGPPDVVGTEDVSFGDLRTVGTTDARGALHAERLPSGRAAVAANLDSLLNGPRGLDARTSVPVRLSASRSASARVALPFSLAALGAVEGRVVGPDGGPVARAQVTSGYFRTYADAQGRFRMPHLRAGSRTVTASSSGFAAAGATAEVPAGGTASVEIRLAYAEEGPVTITGAVHGPDGEEVAGATVYVIDDARRGTLRTVKADDRGAFVVPGLPQSLQTAAFRLQADRFPAYAAANVKFPQGYDGRPLEVTLPVRFTLLRVDVRDASRDAPVPRCLCSAAPTSADGPRASTLVWDGAASRYEGYVAPGRYDVRVDELDHEPAVAGVDVPASTAPCDVTVRLVPRGTPSVPLVLDVVLASATTGEPVRRATVEILERAGGDAFSRLEGTRDDGVYRLPAASGDRSIRVSAPGFETHEAALPLATKPAEATIRVALRPR